MMIMPVVTAIFPRMVELATNPQSPALARVYHQGAQAVAVAVAPVAVTLACFSGGAVFAWSGDAALATRVQPILSVLVLGTFLNGLMQMPYHLQLAFGWTGLAIKANLVAVALLIPVLWWTVPRYGAVSAAWVWLALNAAYLLVCAQVMHRRLLPAEKVGWYLFDIALPIAAAAAAALLALLIQPAPYQNRWHWFAFLAGCSALAYVFAALSASTVRPRLMTVMRTCPGPVAKES